MKMLLTGGELLAPCIYCELVFNRSGLTFEHIKPRSQGGPFNFENLFLACVKCNLARRTLPFDVFWKEHRRSLGLPPAPIPPKARRHCQPASPTPEPIAADAIERDNAGER